MKKFYLNPFFFLVSLFHFMGYSQIGFYEVPLKSQVESSKLIIEGEVISKRAFWDEKQEKIYTVNTIEISKVFKGISGNLIDVLTLGGNVGDIALTVSHSPNLHEGDFGVFFLRETNKALKRNDTSKNKEYEIYSGMQGYYKYDEISQSIKNIFSIYKNSDNEFYNLIKGYTNIDYYEKQVIDRSAKIISGKLVPFISNFSPTSSAAGVGAEIVINGFTFGTTKGKVQFSNANDGGTSFIDALDSEVTNWTNTSITVKVPSRAGTGPIRVLDASGFSSTSSGSLTIPYAIINNSGVMQQHYDTNGSGGYTWQMSSDFNTHVAREPFLRAFNTWVCETGVNWEISSSTTFASSFARDGISVIAFDTSTDELDAGVLGATLNWTSSCTAGRVIDEIDFIFDDERSNWNYSETNAGPGEVDFETVVLHELGHGHALAHVISPGSLMHFSISNGSTIRTLDANDMAAGEFVHNISVNNPKCSKNPMISISCPPLSISEIDLASAIKLYPNPTKGKLFVKTDSSIRLERIYVYDISGRLLKRYDLTPSMDLEYLNFSTASSGVYFIKIYTENTSISKRIVFE